LQQADGRARFVGMGANRGYGAAANVGAALVASDVVIVCNPDLEVIPGAVPSLLAALEADAGIGAIGPRIDRVDGTRYPSARAFPSLTDAVGHGFVGLVSSRNRWSKRYLRTDADDAGSVDWVSGAFIAVRRTAFEQIGGFDEAYFMFMEDVDLCRRLHEAGWEVRYEPRARVTHLEGASRASAPYRMILEHHGSLLRYAWRTGDRRDHIVLPVVAVGLAVRAALMCARTAMRGTGKPGSLAG
jgi:N-acetylglucosaminyl-diphospho-decaprenol L-rhamnosyltransferase